jgi:SAM-dependent methyltransferase
LNDWVSELGQGNTVLDVASASGSFPLAGLECPVILIDEDIAALGVVPAASGGKRRAVAGRCEQLPLASSSIDLVVCNHALEHFAELNPALDEIARVLKPTGRLFVSVPNGYGVCDGVYRWVFEGGGHMNRFRRDELVRLVESRVGVQLAQWQVLYSSFGYLRGICDLPQSPELQPRLRRLARLPHAVIEMAQTALYVGTRAVDRCLGTTTAVYGWAFWFDRVAGPSTERTGLVNVCVYCGGADPGEAPGRRQLRGWGCLACGGWNRFWFG